MDKKLKILAVVPIYLPDYFFIDNVKTYLEYVDCLLIINNSNTSINNFSELSDYKNVFYYNPEINIGLSKSYNYALRYGLINNYDYLLIMDQDSKFINFSIWNQLKKLNRDKRIALISAASSFDRSDYIKPYDNNFYERKIIMSSGTFLSIQSSIIIGYFDEKFFIDEIDHDYSLKCYKKGFINISSYDLHLSHSVGEPYYVSTPMNFFKKKITIHQPFRYYHIFRNGRIMIFRYLFTEPSFSLKKIRSLFKTLIKILLFYPQKHKYFFYIFKSLINERN